MKADLEKSHASCLWYGWWKKREFLKKPPMSKKQRPCQNKKRNMAFPDKECLGEGK